MPLLEPGTIFTTATVAAPAADLFHFTPPEGAKEVPNVASRRQKQ